MRRRARSRGGLFLQLIFAIGWSLSPFLWFALASLKSPQQIAAVPPEIVPHELYSGNFARVIFERAIWLPLRNSAVVATITTLVTLPVAALAGYALARLRFRGRAVMLAGVLAASMFPQITIAPTIVRWLYGMGWINTYRGLVLPYVSLTLPLAVWVLAASFREIPGELEEAARVDGCGPLSILARIFFPVAAPAIFTAAILTFIYSWNEFFFAVIIADNPSVRTLPVAIARFHGRFDLPWGEVSAASLIATLPLLSIVVILQRRIVHGLTAGALKS